jgi:hypothetical protein
MMRKLICLLPLLLLTACPNNNNIEVLPELSFTVAPQQLTIKQGGSATVNVTLTRKNLSSEITINLSEAPLGISATPVKTQIESASLTISASEQAKVGVNDLKITATAGVIKADANYRIVVEPKTTSSKPEITAFSATPNTLPAGGGNTSLAWQVNNADSLSIDQNVGTVTGNSKTVAVPATTTFALTASNGSGTSTANTTVVVQGTPPPPPPPPGSHPRLWIRAADLPKLRSWAVNSNPIYVNGLKLSAEQGKTNMDAGNLSDTGNYAYESDPLEQYAALFAFMSLVGPENQRVDYAARGRKLLMQIINEAVRGVDNSRDADGNPVPYRNVEFSTSDRSRWNGSAFPLAVDWLYPILTSDDKAKIRTTFLRWASENLDDDSSDGVAAYPCGQELSCFPADLRQAENDPRLLAHEGARWSQNNYFAAHTRNVIMMALAFDANDDAGGELKKQLNPAIKRWLYVTDGVLRQDAAGGLGAEGFEYSPQTLGYIAQTLLALKTAGEDDVNKWGRQVSFEGNPFWQAILPAYLHSLAPEPTGSGLNRVYQAAWFGDGQENWSPDPIEAFGTLASYANISNQAQLAAQYRFAINEFAPGGPDSLLRRARGNDNRFNYAISYFLAFEPGANNSDPRPALATRWLVPGIGKLLARSNWSKDTAWFNFTSGWNSIDHQAGDALSLEFYQKGEWIAKRRIGYGCGWMMSDNNNSLTLENDPVERTDCRKASRDRGSQWAYSGGDATLVANSLQSSYVYALGDGTNSYNSQREGSTDITLATRSVLWLDPSLLVIYDRAESKADGRFKRFNLTIPANVTVAGNVATIITPKNQTVKIKALLPSNATVTASVLPQTDIDESMEQQPKANGEPDNYRRLVTEATGKPKTTRFLHVLDGLGNSDSTLLRSGDNSFEGAVVGTTAVLFPVAFNRQSTSASFTQLQLNTSASRILLTGLAPNSNFGVSVNGATVTITTSGSLKSDSGGVLDWQR